MRYTNFDLNYYGTIMHFRTHIVKIGRDYNYLKRIGKIQESVPKPAF